MLHYQQRSFRQHSQHRNCVRKRSVCASQDAGCFFPAWRRGVGRGGKGTGKETTPYLGWKLIWDRFVPGAPCIKPDCTAGCSPGHLSFRQVSRTFRAYLESPRRSDDGTLAPKSAGLRLRTTTRGGLFERIAGGDFLNLLNFRFKNSSI